jgi:hypothetical protein
MLKTSASGIAISSTPTARCGFRYVATYHNPTTKVSTTMKAMEKCVRVDPMSLAASWGTEIGILLK